MNLAVDFDSTIMDPNNKNPGYRMGQPVKGAVLYINRLVKAGHKVYIFTARNVNQPTAHKAVEDWLKYYNIPHHGITNIKQPYFDLIIDNRAIEFTEWAGILTKIHKFDIMQESK